MFVRSHIYPRNYQWHISRFTKIIDNAVVNFPFKTDILVSRRQLHGQTQQTADRNETVTAVWPTAAHKNNKIKVKITARNCLEKATYEPLCILTKVYPDM
jgi:lipopolysaccharide assembly outer membrane protein LptD (OstA)